MTIFLERLLNHHVFFHQESGTKSTGTDDVGRKTSGEACLNTIFVPPPEFQSSPLNFQQDSKTVENGAKCSEPEEDLFQTFNHNRMQDLFQTPTLAQNASTNGHYHDVTLNSPDIFKTNPPQTQNLSKNWRSKGSDLFKGEVEDLFQAAKGEGSDHAAHDNEVNLFDKSPSIFVDPVKSPSNKEDDLFQSPQCTAVNPFRSATTTALFQAVPTESGLVRPKSSSTNDWDVFSPSSTNTVDPFPSPITRELFQDLSSLDDPFGPTPKKYDPFQDASNGTPDTFQPLPSNTVKNSDIFKITPSNTASKAMYSTPSLSSPSGMNLDTLSSPDLFKATPSESLSAIQTKSSNWPHEIVLTTPQGTKHDILQPTPFSQARELSVSSSQSPAEMTHVCTKCHLMCTYSQNVRILYYFYIKVCVVEVPTVLLNSSH